MLVAALAVIAASLNAGLPEPIAGTAAAGYVPAPSSRTLLVDETSRLVTTVEWSHAAGLAGVIQGPAAFSNLAMSIEEVSSMSWVRSVLTEIGPNGKVSGRIYRLYGLTDRGLELFVEASDTAGLSYKPGLVVLPADVRAGSDWRSEGGIFLFQGDSRPIDGHYTYTGTATAADGDCLAVHAVLNLGQGPVSDGTQRWCAGRGITAIDSKTEHSVEASGFPDWADPRRNLRLAGGPRTWSTPDTWQFRQTSYEISRTISADPSTGAMPTGPNTYSFVHKDSALIGIRLEKGVASTHWLAIPGAPALHSTTSGEVTIIATTRRELVAYNAEGQWLWTQPTSGIASSLAALSPTVLVVGSSDGTVTAHDTATGRQLWQRSVATEPAAAPVVVWNVGVLMADSGGTVSLIKPDGSTAWELDMREGVRAMAASSEVVVLFRGTDPAMTAFSTTTGEARWTVQKVSSGSFLVAGEYVYRVTATGQLLTNRVSDGSPGPRLALSPSASAVTDGTSVLAVATDSIQVITGGVPGRLWTLPVSNSPNVLWINPTEKGVVVSGTNLQLTIGGPT